MPPGVDEATLRAHQARAYEHPLESAGVSVVLGAGNVGSLAPKDAIHQLVGEGRVVVVKANPVNAYLVEYWSRALAALIEKGFVALVTGATEVGEYLVHHPDVDHVHVTGSASTYDAIVFGEGEDGERRKARGERKFTKSLSAELGNVSPVIIVPGVWSQREIDYQAAHVATMLVNNAGFNCVTPRVIITSRYWAQRGEFLDALERTLGAAPTREAYYPGAFARRDRFLAAHPEARELGVVTPGAMAWTLVRDVDARETADVCFNVEAFCALTSETALEGDTPEHFLRLAVDFCNDVVHGTLSATLLVDPRTSRRPGVTEAVDQAVADLRYGTIGVNVWHALGILVASTPWGAHLGPESTEIQSGVGVVATPSCSIDPRSPSCAVLSSPGRLRRGSSRIVARP